MKHDKKEQVKNGTWKLTFHWDFNQKTYRQSIAEWLDENDKYERNRSRNESKI